MAPWRRRVASSGPGSARTCACWGCSGCKAPVPSGEWHRSPSGASRWTVWLRSGFAPRCRTFSRASKVPSGVPCGKGRDWNDAGCVSDCCYKTMSLISWEMTYLIIAHGQFNRISWNWTLFTIDNQTFRSLCQQIKCRQVKLNSTKCMQINFYRQYCKRITFEIIFLDYFPRICYFDFSLFYIWIVPEKVPTSGNSFKNFIRGFFHKFHLRSLQSYILLVAPKMISGDFSRSIFWGFLQALLSGIPQKSTSERRKCFWWFSQEILSYSFMDSFWVFLQEFLQMFLHGFL